MIAQPVPSKSTAIGSESVQLHDLTIKGAKIVVHDSGHGTPFLFLHGSPDSHAMWLPTIQHLQTHTRCLALDLPGFGQSTLPSDFSLSLDNEADFIHQLLHQLSITTPIVLLMTDFGGHYGMAFAVKYPQMVRGLVISNTNFFPDYQWHSFAKLYRIPLLGEFLLASTRKPILQKAMKNYAPRLPESYFDASFASGFGSPKVRKTILRMYRERDAQDFAGWDARLLKLLAEKPSLVLWGDQDPFITPDYANRFGQARVQHFPDYSHWLPLEAPEAYAKAVLDWWADVVK